MAGGLYGTSQPPKGPMAGLRCLKDPTSFWKLLNIDNRLTTKRRPLGADRVWVLVELFLQQVLNRLIPIYPRHPAAPSKTVHIYPLKEPRLRGFCHRVQFSSFFITVAMSGWLPILDATSQKRFWYFLLGAFRKWHQKTNGKNTGFHSCHAKSPVFFCSAAKQPLFSMAPKAGCLSCFFPMDDLKLVWTRNCVFFFFC